jgi:hypothetical protein
MAYLAKGISAEEATCAVREVNPNAVETAAQEECLRDFSKSSISLMLDRRICYRFA